VSSGEKAMSRLFTIGIVFLFAFEPCFAKDPSISQALHTYLTSEVTSHQVLEGSAVELVDQFVDFRGPYQEATAQFKIILTNPDSEVLARPDSRYRLEVLSQVLLGRLENERINQSSPRINRAVSGIFMAGILAMSPFFYFDALRHPEWQFTIGPAGDTLLLVLSTSMGAGMALGMGSSSAHDIYVHGIKQIRKDASAILDNDYKGMPAPLLRFLTWASRLPVSEKEKIRDEITSLNAAIVHFGKCSENMTMVNSI
jgi:hypothetical protein